jgi:hypothetical protein
MHKSKGLRNWLEPYVVVTSEAQSCRIEAMLCSIQPECAETKAYPCESVPGATVAVGRCYVYAQRLPRAPQRGAAMLGIIQQPSKIDAKVTWILKCLWLTYLVLTLSPASIIQVKLSDIRRGRAENVS